MKYFALFLILSFSMFFTNIESYSFPLVNGNQNSSQKGHWKQIEIITHEEVFPASSIELSITGRNGMARIILNDKGKTGTIDWLWSPPPEILVPNTQWRSKITGRVQEWDLSDEIASTLMMKFQAYRAGCCDFDGVDFGMVDINPGTAKDIKEKKELTYANSIPALGDLESGSSSRIQFFVNIIQHGGSYQWIYVYEWVNAPAMINIKLTIGNQRAEVNANQRFLDSPPYISNHRTFVPFRLVGEAFGAFIDYTVDDNSGKTHKVIYELDRDEIIFDIFEQSMKKNGQRINNAPPVEIRNHRTMVPVRVLSENLGARVSWDGTTSTVTITLVR